MLPGPIDLANTDPTSTREVRHDARTNVAAECDYTWMCTPPPWGPDDHPNNAGYAVIATEIEEKLPRGW